ncbi:MAG TPA: hypothetical protein VGD81_06595, partial [Opitutaceae bacterium]
AGLPLACIGFLWSNRLLPIDLPGRAEWEVRCFLFVWGAGLLHAFVRRPARAWAEQLAAAGALCLLLPLLDALTAGAHLRAAIDAGDTVYLGLEALIVALGLALLVGARGMARKAPAERATSAPAEAALTATEPRP